jgi:PAS domain S-box-containing protein
MSKEIILIVEDDGILSLHLHDSLVHLEYSVLDPVATGEAGITAVAEFHPDLVLMDIQLAGKINGISAAEKIRETSFIPVVFLTSYSDYQLLQQAKKIVPYGYLVKPVSDQELAATIEMALYRHSLDRKLRESEERFHAIWDKSFDGMRLTDADGTIVMVNTAFCRHVGKTHTELEDHPLDVMYDSKEGQRILASTVEKFRDKSVLPHFERLVTLWDGRKVWFELSNSFIELETGQHFLLSIFRDITERKQTEEVIQDAARERERLIKELKHAAGSIKTLQGLIPICANCKKIRDDKGFWNRLEMYIHEHTDAKFSHGICPECMEKLYGYRQKNNP